jgi:hypothetical protein
MQREHEIKLHNFWKPTSTVTIIHNSSCDSNEHKIASINYLTNRLYPYPISKQAKDMELGIIKIIVKNNQYKHVYIHTKP